MSTSKLDRLFAPFKPPKTNLVDRLRYWCDAQPEAIAFYFLTDGEEEEIHITYRELEARARAIAVRLHASNMQGERALLLFPPGLEFVEAFFGCLFAGAIPVPAYPPRRNRNMMRIQAISEDSDASVAMSVSDVIDRVAGMLEETPQLQRLEWLATDRIDSSLADQWQPPAIDGQDLALLQYTSGSTGDPKGVMIPHDSLMHNCGLITESFEFSRSGCGMTWLPTYHDMGLLGGVLSPLFFGRPNVLMSPMSFLQKPVRWLQAITRYQVTVSGGPNFAYALCNEKVTAEECEDLDLRTWDVAFNGAEPVRSDTLAEFTRKFGPYGFRQETHFPCYGMAETTLIVTGGPKQNAPVVRWFDGAAIDEHRIVSQNSTAPGARAMVGCGQVLRDGKFTIVDADTLTAAPNGRIGEIWIQSPSAGRGYWQRPEVSEATFRASIEGDDSGTYLRTGDLGFLADGELFVTGRLKDLIIIRGVNRYPQDIEATVEACSDRLQTGGAAAFAVDVDGRERLLIVCEVERSRNKEWGDVLEVVRRNVASQHELPPDGVILVRAGSIPKTSSGKIQRHACRQDFEHGKLLVVAQWLAWQTPDESQFEQAAAAPAAPVDVTAEAQVESIVLDVVRAVAGERARDLTADSNIVVDLGLDSLERLQIANELEERFGGRFPDEVLQKIETCREVAEAIRQHIGTQPVSTEPISDSPGTKPVPSAHYDFTRMPEYVRFSQTKRLLIATGLSNPFFSICKPTRGGHIQIEDRELLDFSSFDYLGLATEPMIREAAAQAIREEGTGISSSRFVTGNRQSHVALEAELSRFMRTGDAAVFSANHGVNVSVIGHMFGGSDLVIYDALAANGLMKGAELSGARRRPFEHNDLAKLDAVLRKTRGDFRRVLVAVSGVTSTEGDVVDLATLVEMKERHRAMLLVDEAHSFGTLGACGAGLGEHYGIPADKVDFWTGSLSHALASSGGYVAGSAELIEYLRYTAPAFVHEAAIAPAAAATALAALKFLQTAPERIAQLQANARMFRQLLRQRRLQTSDGQFTPIVPVMTGNSLHTLQLAARLRQRNILAHPVVYPVVEEERARLRIVVTSAHTDSHLRQLVEAISDELHAINEDALASPA